MSNETVELHPCWVCNESRMLISKDPGANGEDMFCAHCAACGLSTRYFTSREALLFYWNKEVA